MLRSSICDKVINFGCLRTLEVNWCRLIRIINIVLEGWTLVEILLLLEVIVWEVIVREVRIINLGALIVLIIMKETIGLAFVWLIKLGWLRIVLFCCIKMRLIRVKLRAALIGTKLVGALAGGELGFVWTIWIKLRIISI